VDSPCIPLDHLNQPLVGSDVVEKMPAEQGSNVEAANLRTLATERERYTFAQIRN
jgi:hypothetical protein